MGPHTQDMVTLLPTFPPENSAIIIREILAAQRKSTWVKGLEQEAKVTPGHET